MEKKRKNENNNDKQKRKSRKLFLVQNLQGKFFFSFFMSIFWITRRTFLYSLPYYTYITTQVINANWLPRVN